MQQQQALNPSQKDQQNKRNFEIIEDTARYYNEAVNLLASKLQSEDAYIYSKQWSLLKFVINHPEYLHLISNREWLDREARSIFDKLKKYVQELKNDKSFFDPYELKTRFTLEETTYYDSEIEQVKEPGSLFDAQQLCALLQEYHYNRERFYYPLRMLLAEDKETASLYARQFIGLSDDSEVQTLDFGLDSTLPKTKFTLMKDGVPILEDQNFYVVMGMEKSGKSHFLAVFLAAYLFGSLDSFGLKSLIDPKSKILYIDTEQSSSDALNICQTANLLAGRRYNEPNDRLIISSCDTVPTNQLLETIQSKIDRIKPKVVFIDGYAGLVDDVYKNTGVDSLMKNVRKMARVNELVIIGVFHEKKNEANPLASKKESSSAFGAAGKLFERYGGGTFSVSNEDGLTTVENIKSRKAPCPTFYFQSECQIYIDEPGKENPVLYIAPGGKASEVLEPMHKTVNDDEVHSFYVPQCLSEEEHEKKTIISKIDKEDRDKAKTEQEKKEKLERKTPKYEILFSSIFEGENDFLTHEEMRERFKQIQMSRDKQEIEDLELSPGDKIPKNFYNKWRGERKEAIDNAKSLGILYEVSSGKWGFRVISKKE